MAVYAGREIRVWVDLNSVGGSGANWIAIGQQRGGGISRTTETADATHKDDIGWPSAVVTRTPWSISVDGAMDPADSAWGHLLGKWRAKAKPWIKVDASAIGGERSEGQAIITDLSYEFPESDLVTFSAEFQGDGALVASP
jgi:predicted secreted protein